jgi:magnesium-transporting ATPase (P-type)
MFSNDNLLLAGTFLKNTREVYAVCVYAGTQTKMSLNSKITKNKFSTIERSLNRYLLFLVGILITEIVSSTILAYSFNNEFYKVKKCTHCVAVCSTACVTILLDSAYERRRVEVCKLKCPYRGCQLLKYRN